MASLSLPSLVSSSLLGLKLCVFGTTFLGRNHVRGIQLGAELSGRQKTCWVVAKDGALFYAALWWELRAGFRWHEAEQLGAG